MFGIGGTELLVILVVALIVLGPKSVPQIARTLGKAMGEFRRVSTEFQRTLNTEIEVDEHEKRKQEAEKELFGTAKMESTGATSVPTPGASTPPPAPATSTAEGATPAAQAVPAA
ncbi:MAG: Sec-independent protein translocase protein TatB, partial [Bilophila sp.]